MASRKIAIRIITVYALCAFTVGFNVPYDDPNLRNLAISSIPSGQHSVFIIAAVRDHVRGMPHFFNAFFIFSATSAGINALYLSSRLLHSLARTSDAWPAYGFKWLRERLVKTTRDPEGGVPRAAVLASWFFGLLAFMCTQAAPSKILGRLATNASASILIVYTLICVAYVRFFMIIDLAAQRKLENPRRQAGRLDYNTEHYNRKADTYPYRSRVQYFRACYGAVGCGLLALANGWRTFSPWSGGDWAASYVSMIVFIVIVFAYEAKRGHWVPWKWHQSATKDIRDPIVVESTDPDRRKGRLKLETEELFTWENVAAVRRWLRVWIE